MTHHILAVDDSLQMLEVYQYLLTERGYKISTAKNGHEALEVLESKRPDLILLDIDMPKVSGWELLEIIRSRPDWRDIPVVMVTALVEPASEARARLPQYECYVTKKATGNDLLLLVEGVLAGTLA